MTCFETERLLVRHLSYDDLDDFSALNSDPVAMQYMGDGEILSRDACRKWIDVCLGKYQQRGYGTSAVIEKATGGFVGFCGVIRTPENDYDEIIYALAQSYWGKGYATEVARGMLAYVFDVSELDEIYATIHPNNLASQKMMSKLNMTYLDDRPNDDGSLTKYYVLRRENLG